MGWFLCKMNQKDYQHFLNSLDEFVFWSIEGEESLGNPNYQKLERRLMDSMGGYEEFVDFLKRVRQPPTEIFRLINLVFNPGKVKLEKGYHLRASIDIDHNIIISEEFTTEERIKALLHELFHMHPRHFAYTITDMHHGRNIFLGHHYRRLEAEAEIDADVKNTLEQNPRLADYFCSKMGWS